MEVEVVVAHAERATVRVGDTFVKLDGDPSRLEVELQAMELAPVPTPTVLWHRPPAMALAALRGAPLGRLGQPSLQAGAAWESAGAVVAALHAAPLPPWDGPSPDVWASRLHDGCTWLAQQHVLADEVIDRNRRLAEFALEPRAPAFIHGDLQVDHVFVDDDRVTGVLDWSEACRGDPAFDLATLTLGHPERLDAVLAGYASDIDREAVRAWWSLRCLSNVRWLTEHGFGPVEQMPEVAVLEAQARPRR